MPTPTITYRIEQEITAPSSYTATVTVLDTVGIDREIFVFDSHTDAFTGVATLYDMLTWPRAADTNLMSYRKLSVSRAFSTPDAAKGFVSYTQGRIESLRHDWQTVSDNFPTETIVTTPRT